MKYEISIRNNLKNIRDNFTVTPNPFNQNLNYEKILRFSITKIKKFFLIAKIFHKKIYFCKLKFVK
jgi:hypothetical protein